MGKRASIAWLTDIHLDHASPAIIRKLAQDILVQGVGGVVITGDISNAPSVVPALRTFYDLYNLPTYFVLGNHDFYGASIQGVRRLVQEAYPMGGPVQYVGLGGVHQLSEKTVVVGVDGWSDGLAASFLHSRVLLNDYDYIKDLVLPTKFQLAEKLAELGREEAGRARVALQTALQTALQGSPKNVLFLTHPPPFRGSCWHGGKLSDNQWMPHFVCMQVGEVLMEAALESPGVQFTVLCGHTHSMGEFQPLGNLLVRTGGAVYKIPEVAGILEIE